MRYDPSGWNRNGNLIQVSFGTDKYGWQYEIGRYNISKNPYDDVIVAGAFGNFAALLEGGAA